MNHYFKSSICALALTLTLTGCQKNSAPRVDVDTTQNQTATQNPTTSQNEQLDTWFEDVFMESVAHYPQVLTQLGIKTDYDKWNNPSKEFYLARLEDTRHELDTLHEKFDPKTLDKSHQLSYRLFEADAQRQLDGAKWWEYGYNFNQMFGQQSNIPAFLINQHRIDNLEDAQAYIARLQGIKDFMGVHVKNAQHSAKLGIATPKFVYDHVIRDAQNIITGEPFVQGTPSTLLSDFTTKVEKLDLTTDQKNELITDARLALISSVKPAYENLIAAMKELKSQASTDDGVWKLPKGDEYYAYRLKQMTTTDMTATEIHELGLAEMDRIHGEMRNIMKKVGFEGTLQEFFTHLKTDPAQFYEDSDAGRAAYLTRAEEIIEAMKARLGDVFARQPKADLIVKRVEAFREKSAGKAFYNRPAPDGSRPGVYYANLYAITDMPKYQMEALAYHEGIPGHHMQIAIQQELENMPKFRKFSSVTAYSEGWGLYSEFLPKEMGFYQDPYSDFGRLAMELWRAARLVVDTGIHDKKWTHEEAIDYLTTNTPNPENDAIKAIERYIIMPGQATAYKIGMLKILDLREDAKRRLGDDFDIREYHDVILASGPVPLDIMEERVEAWIATKQK